MFQGSAQVKKMEHVSLMQQAGGVVNGSTRLDYTNYFEVLPSNALELALWLEADRMRSLDVSAENLKNQQNVVSEEVRVNVLNQPHAAFEWLDIWQRANTNWSNAHNFYGDLARARGGDARRRAQLLQDLLRAEQRRAGGRRRYDAPPTCGSSRRSISAAFRGSRCRRRPMSPSRRRRKRSASPARTSSRARRRWPSAGICRERMTQGLLRAERARSARSSATKARACIRSWCARIGWRCR